MSRRATLMKDLHCCRCVSFCCDARRSPLSSQPPTRELGDILTVAYLTKTLTASSAQILDADSIPISERLVLAILQRGSIECSKKLDFFKWCSLKQDYKHTPRTYSAMFHTVCGAGFLGEIPDLLRSLKDDRVVVDDKTFKFLLDSFIGSRRFDDALALIDHMEELRANPDQEMYDGILVALAKNDQVDLCLSIFFKLLRASPGGCLLVPGSVASNTLLVALRKSEMKVEFQQVFHELRNKGYEFDLWGYNICIRALGCWGDLGASLSLFEEMKERSIQGRLFGGPDLCTYNSLILALCLAGKVSDALSIHQELKLYGHEPDAFTYRTLIQGFCRCYRMEEATRIFNEMQLNGFVPDTVVFNSLLNGMFKARRVMEACHVFEKMVHDGIPPSCCTYNTLIDGLCRNGRASAAYSLFCDLKKKGKLVDAITYSIIVLQLCREGELEEAMCLVEEMEERGFVVDLVTMTSLLIAFHKHGRPDWTGRLMGRIRNSDLLPGVLHWNMNIEPSLRDRQSWRKDCTPMFPIRGNLSEIMNFLHSPKPEKAGGTGSGNGDQWSSSPHIDHLASQVKMSNHSGSQFSLVRGRRVKAKGINSFDIGMVNTFLSIFMAEGKLSLACKLFEMFQDMGTSPATYSYNSIMSCFVKKGYFNEAWGILHEMGEKLCPSDIATYNVVVQGLGKMGRADLASSVLEKLMKEGGYLDIVMYNTLINALGKGGKMEEARKLFQQMKANGISADVVTYNILIDIHSKSGYLKEAHEFLKMMLDAGCLPNHVTDTTLDFLANEIGRQEGNTKTS